MSERTLSELANAEIVPDMGGPNAWSAFNEGVDEDVPRIVLVDTFSDEVDETPRLTTSTSLSVML